MSPPVGSCVSIRKQKRSEAEAIRYCYCGYECPIKVTRTKRTKVESILDVFDTKKPIVDAGLLNGSIQILGILCQIACKI